MKTCWNLHREIFPPPHNQPYTTNIMKINIENEKKKIEDKEKVKK